MTTGREWGGLRRIVEEAREISRQDKERPLVECPICGTRLQRNARGEADCPFGDYRTTAQTWGEAGLA